MRNCIVPAAKRAGIQKQVSLHVFLHTFSTPLAAQWRRHQEVQSLLRHANPRNHFGFYTHAVSKQEAGGAGARRGDGVADGAKAPTRWVVARGTA